MSLTERVFDESKHPRDPGGEGGGQWIPKGTTASDESKTPRLNLKGGADAKKLTETQVVKKAQMVSDDLAKFYGSDKRAVVRFEPEATATWDTDARTLIPPSQESTGKTEIWFGQNVMDDARDPDFGVSEFRKIAHESVHANVSGQRNTSGFYHDFEEGGAEVLSINYWDKRGQPFDSRDATRVSGRWTDPGAESLAHSVVYRRETEDILRRAASRVGWDRAAVVSEVHRVVAGDSGVRLEFRDTTDPSFAPPTGATNDAVGLISWLIGN